VQAQTKVLTDELNQRAQEAGFALRPTQTSITPVPLANGHLLPADQFASMSKGEVVGQINGLAVLALGDHASGKPSRITARVSLGRGQLLNIEREARMSGRIHDKGFVILSSYIQGKYGQTRPLSLQASIGFEQSYDEIDGDSASSTELYALLSQLSGKPLVQGIAVTGSINQNGEVQATGARTRRSRAFRRVQSQGGSRASKGS